MFTFMSSIEQVAPENSRHDPGSMDQDTLLTQESIARSLDGSVLTIFVAGQVIVTNV